MVIDSWSNIMMFLKKGLSSNNDEMKFYLAQSPIYGENFG